MYGAILGDIAGSRFEFSRPQNFDWKTTDFFGGMSTYTDAKAYSLFGKRYSRVGYGTMFKNWLNSSSQKGYNSFGNGAAMRVSYIGWHYPTLEEVGDQAVFSALVTHNHPEGVKAAQATAEAVFLARTGSTKKEIVRHLHKKFGYVINTPLFLYRPFGKFDDTAMGSMPLAIRCFVESEDWQSCIRNVFSVKCDTDTVACIAGGIADAYYGGTGLEEDTLLKRFLIKPNERGEFDTFLYEWATKTPEQVRQEREEKAKREKEEKEKGGVL